jgi:hypothetical protein
MRELELDHVPPPGEPLQEFVDPQNEQIITRELERRLSVLKNKLSGIEIIKINLSIRFLWQKLRTWNSLVKELNTLHRAIETLRYRYKKSPGERNTIKAQASRLISEYQNCKQRLMELRPTYRQYLAAHRAIELHNAAVKWEKEDRENRAAFAREADAWEAQIKAVFRQSARLHHIYNDEKGRSHMVTPHIERRIIKDDKVYFQIQLTYQTFLGRLTQTWQHALPYNVDIDDLVCDETLKNLSAACRRVVTVERGQRGVNLFYVISRLDSPDGIPARVPYSKIIDFYPVHDHHKTPWAAGVGHDRKVIWYNFEDHPHVLIAGSTQSGKSNQVNQMISTLVTMNSPDEVMLMLIDLKGGIEFTHWAGLKHLLTPIVKRPGDVLSALQQLRSHMESRLGVFEFVKAKKLSDYNEKYQRMPRIVAIVDEMATLIGLGERTTEIQNELRVISSQGRAVGIHLVICTQHSSVDVLPGWVKTNMILRISGKMPSDSASRVILDTGTAATLPDIPGRLVFSIGRSEIVVQSPYISDEEIARAVSISRDYPDPQQIEYEITPVPQKPEFSREDVLRLAISSYDGKLSPSEMWRDGLKDSGVIGWIKLNELVNGIKAEREVVFEGTTYDLQVTRGGGRRLVIKSNRPDPEEANGKSLEDGLELELET